jgi:hypothetical protein
MASAPGGHGPQKKVRRGVRFGPRIPYRPRWPIDDGNFLLLEVNMNGLVGWGEGGAGPRTAGNPGFVPQLESLEARVALSTWSAGKKVKIDFVDENPHIPAHVFTLPPPAPALAAAPADPDAPPGLVHAPAGQDGFHSVWVGPGDDVTTMRSGKATPILF